jgi:hypothetical protein
MNMKKIFLSMAIISLFLPLSLRAKSEEVKINVIPYPQSVTMGNGTFKSAGANFNCDQAIGAESQRVIKELAGQESR